jgi:peptidoglycan/xylan/chitin deacetylase (PgdA/CDA1 family)
MKKIILFVLLTNILFANVITLTSGEVKSGNIAQDAMLYYKISATDGKTVKTILNGLADDGDLYIKIGSKPTTTSYDCRSVRSDTLDEDCSVTLVSNADVFIGVYGYKATAYQIKATIENNSSNIYTLTSGTAQSGSVSKGETKYYKISANKNQSVTSLLNQLTSDADIYVKVGERATSSNYDCKSTNGDSNDDSCTVTLAHNSDLFIAIYGYKASQYNITATINHDENNSVTTLTSGVASSGSIAQGRIKYYKIAAVDGQTFSALLNGLSADSDLYVKIGDKPTTNSFDCSSENGGTTNDSCSFTIHENSDIYLGVYGFRASNYNITATLKSNEVPEEKDLVVYEDAEDQTISRWSITDNTPAGATITNIYDADKDSRVINFTGSDSYENQYQIGEAWNNRENFNITWDMKTTEGYIIDIQITTTNGDRNLRYNDNELSYKLKDDSDIIHGLGYHSTDGTWHTHRRNLEKDLKDLEPNNNIISINSFLIRAKASIDNIELFSSPNKVYEDAEDNQKNRWSIYAGANNAQITNINDSTKGSRVISFEGNNVENKYLIGNRSGENNAWADTKHTNLKWSFNSSSDFSIYLLVNTEKGERELKYSNADIDVKGTEGNRIYFGLGRDTSNGKWHTFIRDVAADVKEFDNENNLLSIDGLLVVGNSKIDDLELFNIYKPKNHKAGFSLTFDDYDVDGWYSMRDTYLKYGVKATFFVSHFHTLSAAEIDKLKTLDRDGHEIGCHTYNHEGIGRDYHYDSDRIDEYISKQITPALNNMRDAGFTPVSLAYPYGERNKEYDNAVRAYFPNLRTTASDNNRELYQLDEIFHKKGKHYTILAADGIDNSYNHEIAEIRKAFIKARENGEIITFYAHQIVDDANNHYAISPQKLKEVIKSAYDVGLKFYRFNESYHVGE